MLSVKQVAARLKISPSLVYSWCQYGILPHVRLGRPGCRGTIRIDPDELEGFIAGMMPQEVPMNPVPGEVPLAHVKLKARHG